MHRVARPAVLILAATLASVLAGCAVPIVQPSSPPPTHASPAPTARTLSCADLVSGSELETALGGPAAAADPVIVGVGSALDVAQATAVTAAGGLQCAWRGPARDGFAPTLTVQLLPDPSSQWTPMLFSDGPETATESFGTHTVIATSGDPGYGATARVGRTWTFIERTYPPTGTTPPDTVSSLTPAFTSIFDAAAAEGGLLTSPRSRPTARTCQQVLSIARWSAALGGASRYDATTVDPASQGIIEVGQDRVGDIRCFATGATHGGSFALARGGAHLLEALRTGVPAGDLAAYTPIPLIGLSSGDWAIGRSCGGRPGLCDVIFTRHADAYEVSEAPDPKAVAEAILAQNP
jgi:hypothetical protein